MHNTLYNYDANNRLLNKREIVGGSGSYTGQVEKVTNFTYDKNGNTIKKDIGGQVDRNVVEYVYNPLNQLKEVKSDGIAVGVYTYSGNGLRRSKTANGTITKYYWNGQNMINEAVNGEITATNKYDSYRLYHRSGVGDIVKNDHGDVIGVISQGTITHQYQYDAYGNQKISNENDINPFRYCGEYYDDESGLIYLRNRYYDPDLGRFINEAPIKDGLNWYAYANNNPIKYKDPTGKWGELVHVQATRWMINGAGLNIDSEVLAYHIEIIVVANIGVDSGSTAATNTNNEAQGWHFNRNATGPDSRQVHADEMLNNAVSTWNAADQSYAMGAITFDERYA